MDIDAELDAHLVELTPRLHLLRRPVGHVYLWRDDDGLTLVDTSVPGTGPLGAPGHTEGTIVLHLPAERILFSGDAIERAPDGRTIMPVFNLDSARAEESVRGLATLDFDVLCPAHGEPLTERADAVVRAVAAGLTPETVDLPSM